MPGSHPIVLLLVAVLLGFCPQAPAARPAVAFDHSHAAWTAVLKKAVVGDRIDYGALKKDHAELDGYLKTLHAVNPEELGAWTRSQQFAFWINAYNAHCISLVVSEYPVESIKDLGSLLSPVWKKQFIDMPDLHLSGKPKKLSLHDIEHEILRPQFKDARVHAAINCASESCPPLRAEAFVATRLEEQLDAQVRAWLADKARNRFDSVKRRASVSAILEWFEDDFVRDGGSVAGWLAKYAPETEAAWLKGGKVDLHSQDYSWKLNDLKR
ncbi:MAG: DUF547 domain-containing protein [Planctomycetes bacterium]|nr:DUF547 domain-containing protein [Planctomycetota bacterium]